MTGQITPVLLSGGSGTRLWPLSREARPKQLLPLLGEDTMLQMTAARVSEGPRFGPLVVVARAAHADLVEEQLQANGVAVETVILEPKPRNTAAAIALAALATQADAILLVLPSDHLIKDQAGFLAAVDRARSLAEQGWIVTFGIRPDHPETGYGYILQGEPLGEGAFAAEAFVEKPDAVTARAYVDAGTYHWNGGIFMFRADAMLAALGEHAPDILDGTRSAWEKSQSQGIKVFPDPDAFGSVRSQSIDHAVMERAAKVAVVPVEMGWSDVGSWDAIAASSPCDADGNVLTGDVLAIASRNCLVRSEKRLVVVAGVEDLVVIETGDAILILPKGESQRTKDAVEALRQRNHPTLDA
jgi:mannose-1-phosphate guanylyltransferase/mannose-1-phosphate guanylyltransferase/mannose-6-phosphate isomerase